MRRFGVTEAKEKRLLERMKELGLREEDIEEKFIRGRGPGGRKINRSAICVQLKHRPTGIVIRMQRERSQAVNRYLARRELADRVEKLVKGSNAEAYKKYQKIRKQKLRRKRRSRSKVEKN